MKYRIADKICKNPERYSVNQKAKGLAILNKRLKRHIKLLSKITIAVQKCVATLCNLRNQIPKHYSKPCDDFRPCDLIKE